MTAEPVASAAAPLEGLVVQAAIRKRSPGEIAARFNITREQVLEIRDRYGYPDELVMRRRLACLLPAAGAGDHPAFTALKLGAIAARDREPFKVQHLIAGMDDLEKDAIIAAAFVLLSPAADFHQLTEWFDLPASEWSDKTLQAEAGRFLDAHARDLTARTAVTEMTRRASRGTAGRSER